MNFSTSTHSRNPVLRAGLQGTTFSTSLLVKSELVSSKATSNINASGSNNFLTISKSRVPDIQMINKYYGLVPKKFVINARSDYSSKQSTKLRARTAQSFDEDISQSLLNERILSKGKIKEIHDDSHLNTQQRSGSNAGDKTEVDVDELVAKKMSVEKHKKWKRIKDCGRSLSMMDNCENMGSTMGTTPNKDHDLDSSDRLDIQRVIKIDLNNMKWEESYQEKSKTDSREREKGISTLTTAAVESLNNAKNNLNQNSNNSDSSGGSAKAKRGFLRKTISFDEQIMRNVTDGTGTTDTDKVELQKLPRRPMTASVRPSAQSIPVTNSPVNTPASTPTPKISTWTSRNGQNQSISERRLKLQKTFSMYQVSVDNGESENEQELSESNNQSNSSSLSQRLRESKKSLHVQPPPEVSTMISLMNPPPAEEDLQTEIDKVVSIIDDVHTKIAQVDVKLLSEESTPDNQASNVITECEENNATDSPETVAPTPAPPEAEPPSASHLFQGKRVLRKAASISCENELLPRDLDDESPGKQVSHRIRPQTSKGKSTVSFANTTNMRLIPPRSSKTNASNTISSSSNSPMSISNDAAGSASPSETSQSQASKNRKILIKKALIEINQSSIHLGRKLNHTRPKTAPTPDKKNAQLNAHHPSQKRQPLKVRSPPMKPIASLRKSSSSLNSKMDSRNSKEGSPDPVKEQSPPDPEPQPSPPKVRVIPRQSFSVVDSVLHGFGPDFHEDGDEDGNVISSFINSKKREECLKIYEKMMKKGCSVKLETIFRGMMTPSEYRLFLQDTEMAEKSSATISGDENIVNHGDAGVSMIEGSETEPKS